MYNIYINYKFNIIVMIFSLSIFFKYKNKFNTKFLVQNSVELLILMG